MKSAYTNILDDQRISSKSDPKKSTLKLSLVSDENNRDKIMKAATGKKKITYKEHA